MKKIISVLIILCLSFTLVAFTTTTTSNDIQQEVQQTVEQQIAEVISTSTSITEKVIKEETKDDSTQQQIVKENRISTNTSTKSYKALPEGEVAPGVTYADLAEFYCGNRNLQYIVNPTTNADHWNNVKYVFLLGDWEYIDINTRWNKSELNYEWHITDNTGGFNNFALECKSNSYFMGNFQNASDYIDFYYYKGEYNVATHATTTGVPGSTLNQPKDIAQQLIDVYVFAKNLYTEFRETGVITNKSTEYEIAKIYSDWLNSLYLEYSSQEQFNPSKHKAEQTFEGAAYSVIFNHLGICAGRACAYQVFMRMEGITCYCVAVGKTAEKPMGHIVAWMLLEGEEWIYENFNAVGLIKVENRIRANSSHYFQQYHYNMVRKMAGLDYDKSLEGKYYYNLETIEPLTQAEFDTYMKNRNNK